MKTTIRTENQSYISPSQAEMREMANQVGVKNFSPSLVEDMCNVISGGRLRSASEMRPDIQNSLLESLKPNLDGDYHKPGSGYTQNLNEAVSLWQNKKLAYHQKVQDFLRSMDFSRFQGSPLQQAMECLKLLASQNGGEPGSDGDTLPIFSDYNTSPERIAKEIMEAVDSAESMTDTEKELCDREGASTLEIAKDMLDGKKHILNISRQLNKLVRMRVARTRKYEPNPEADDVRYRPMRELSEIDRMHSAEWAYPKRYRNYRMVTGQAAVRERVERLEKKQLLYVIVDCSGSMGSTERFYKAGGVLMNRLQAVMSGDAEVKFAFFDSKLYSEKQATTSEEAQALMKEIQGNNFHGGSTAIANCAGEAIARIHETLDQRENLNKPELVIVTDGEDDTTSLTREKLRGIKCHAFIVGGENDHLLKVAQSTGGVGIAL